jgi:glycosyltransferase involved in cell wall biosynthesis
MKLDYFTMVPPWPETTGASLRVNGIYEALRRQQVDVRLVVLGEKPDPATRRSIQRGGGVVYSNRSDSSPAKVYRYLCGACLGRDPIAGHLLGRVGLDQLARLAAVRRPDAVLLGTVYLAPLIPKLQEQLSQSRIIVDNHNVESLLHQRIQARGESLRVRLPAAIVATASGRLEREYLARATQVWACSEVDAGYFRRTYDLPKVHVVPNAIDTDGFALSDAGDGRNIVFTGTLWYPPNHEAARALVQISWRLRARGVEHTLYLVGQGPKAELAREAGKNPSVVLTGRVDDIRPYIAKASVVAVPLQAGSGTKLKILQAMSMGKAVVTTTIGAEGLALSDGIDAIVTDDPERFDCQLARLLHEPHERARLGAAARQHVLRHFSHRKLEHAIGETLREIFPRAAGPSRAQPLAHGDV